MAKLLGIVTEGAKAAPAGTYAVTLKEIQDAVSPFDDKPQWRWLFTVESVRDADDEDEAAEMIGQDLHGYTSQGLSKRHKAYQWICALMGREVESDTSVSEADLIGRKAVALIVDHVKEDGTATTKLQAIRAVKKGKKAAPPVDDDTDDEVPF